MFTILNGKFSTCKTRGTPTSCLVLVQPSFSPYLVFILRSQCRWLQCVLVISCRGWGVKIWEQFDERSWNQSGPFFHPLIVLSCFMLVISLPKIQGGYLIHSWHTLCFLWGAGLVLVSPGTLPVLVSTATSPGSSAPCTLIWQILLLARFPVLLFLQLYHKSPFGPWWLRIIFLSLCLTLSWNMNTFLHNNYVISNVTMLQNAYALFPLQYFSTPMPVFKTNFSISHLTVATYPMVATGLCFGYFS